MEKARPGGPFGLARREQSTVTSDELPGSSLSDCGLASARLMCQNVGPLTPQETMTSWAVGHTYRFRAACSERAVNNLYSMVGSSDIGFSFQIHEVGAKPWKDPDRFLRMSPIHYAANIKTPLLILHSENDLRCPIEQAEQLYVALKLRRRPVEFWRFPEENHEMSRNGKPKHRLKRYRVILDWFERWLRPSEA